MRTAVSIPDELYREALADYVARRERTGLPKDSVADVSQLAAVDRAQLAERVGRLNDAELGLVIAGIDVVLGRG